MDQDIWKELPEELHEPVLVRLPIAAIARFRAVCRKWNALPSSPSFAKQRALLANKEQWFFTFTDESRALFDPSSEKWNHSVYPTGPAREVRLPLASTGGLVCHFNMIRSTLGVSNPLTRSVRELPARPIDVLVPRHRPKMSYGMTSTGNSGGYKVLCVCSTGEYQVYASADESWSLPQRVPPNVATAHLLLDNKSRSVCVDGTTLLYFKRLDPDGLVSYDTSTGRWGQLGIPMPPGSTNQMLAECCGRILLVGILDDACVCVWELEMKTNLWKEVDKMPNEWWRSEFDEATLLGNKGLLMLSLESKAVTELVVTYDPLSRKWVRVPDPDRESPRGRRKLLVWGGVAFYPCLTASA